MKNLQIRKIENQSESEKDILYNYKATSCTCIGNTSIENIFERIVKMKIQGSPNLKSVLLVVEEEKIILNSTYQHLEDIINAISSVTHKILFELDILEKKITLKNHEEILNNWYKVKQKLWKDYQGYEIQLLTETYGNCIEDKTALVDELLQYNNYLLFVNHIVFSLSGEKMQSKKRKLKNVFGKGSLSVTEHRILEESLPLRNVVIKGILNEEEMDVSLAGDFLFNFLNIAEGESVDITLVEYAGQYLINEVGHLHSAEIKYCLEIEDKYSRKCCYSLTQYQ